MSGILSDKQERFVHEYLIDCNATKAAIRAGYSKASARQLGARLYEDPTIKSRIVEALSEIKRSAVASAQERREFLTKVMRGEIYDQVYLPDGDGSYSDYDRRAFVSDRIKAAVELEKIENIKEEKENGTGLGEKVIQFVFSDCSMKIEEETSND